MADHVICMRAGKIGQAGTPDDLYKRPASLFVAGFIGAPPINLMRGRLDKDSLEVGEAVLRYLGANGLSDVTLGIRPETRRFADAGIEGRINEVEPMGRETLYIVDSALGPLRVLEAGAEEHHAMGEPIHLTFHEADTSFFDQETEQRINCFASLI